MGKTSSCYDYSKNFIPGRELTFNIYLRTFDRWSANKNFRKCSFYFRGLVHKILFFTFVRKLSNDFSIYLNINPDYYFNSYCVSVISSFDVLVLKGSFFTDLFKFHFKKFDTER